MPFRPFHDLFPEVAERETRTMGILRDQSGALPVEVYAFLEMYCDEPGCDCRRVLFDVISRTRGRTEAVIGWGWEDADFYRQWYSGDEPGAIEAMKGPSLNLGGAQTEFAPTLLELVRDTLLADPAYIERIKRHYRMFREQIDKPAKNDTPPKTEWWRKKRKLR